jgi:hypothetical protein
MLKENAQSRELMFEVVNVINASQSTKTYAVCCMLYWGLPGATGSCQHYYYCSPDQECSHRAVGSKLNLGVMHAFHCAPPETVIKMGLLNSRQRMDN